MEVLKRRILQRLGHKICYSGVRRQTMCSIKNIFIWCTLCSRLTGGSCFKVADIDLFPVVSFGDTIVDISKCVEEAWEQRGMKDSRQVLCGWWSALHTKWLATGEFSISSMTELVDKRRVKSYEILLTTSNQRIKSSIAINYKISIIKS
jgi:hypothetical protein